MATATAPKNGTGSNKSTKASNAAKGRKSSQRANSSNSRAQRRAGNNNRRAMPEVPTWLATVMSIVGVGVAVGAGLYASRRQWMPTARDWRDNFSGAFADDETDYDNFDQTRNAGPDSMRDHPGDDWDDVDDMADASFPASDPPSFNPGTA
jgi:hypothetical protein